MRIWQMQKGASGYIYLCICAIRSRVDVDVEPTCVHSGMRFGGVFPRGG